MKTLGPIEALGTIWYIEVFDESVDSGAVLSHTKDFLEEFESRYSRFRPSSWLSKLNQERVFSNPDPEFLAILQASLKYYEETAGDFNIAIGERMEASGYDKDYLIRVLN